MVGRMLTGTTPGTFEEHGIEVDGPRRELIVNLSVPQSFVVLGIDEQTHTEKRYLLRVTHAGRLILQ